MTFSDKVQELKDLHMDCDPEGLCEAFFTFFTFFKESNSDERLQLLELAENTGNDVLSETVIDCKLFMATSNVDMEKRITYLEKKLVETAEDLTQVKSAIEYISNKYDDADAVISKLEGRS